MNIILVQWLSKKQFTVETSVFGAEFVTMKQGIDTRGLRYKLRMMDVPISCPSYINWGNMPVVQISNSVCYHTVHESVAMGELLNLTIQVTLPICPSSK